jgi:hypothetical protein
LKKCNNLIGYRKENWSSVLSRDKRNIDLRRGWGMMDEKIRINGFIVFYKHQNDPEENIE